MEEEKRKVVVLGKLRLDLGMSNVCVWETLRRTSIRRTKTKTMEFLKKMSFDERERRVITWMYTEHEVVMRVATDSEP